jgi:hypothetical protein
MMDSKQQKLDSTMLETQATDKHASTGLRYELGCSLFIPEAFRMSLAGKQRQANLRKHAPSKSALLATLTGPVVQAAQLQLAARTPI